MKALVILSFIGFLIMYVGCDSRTTILTPEYVEDTLKDSL